MIRLDTLLFYRMFPELKSANTDFLKLEWALIEQYIWGRLDLFTDPGINEYTKLLAHVVKLNLMAQMGMQIDGRLPPVLTPPTSLAGFKNWLQQTQYGRSIG